jgi:glycosyl transferase family 2
MRVGIAAIVKSEAPYLLEWIAFHRAVGIEAFFIADNGGNDGTSELLKRLEKAGYITRFDFIGQPEAPQLQAYSTIIPRMKGIVELAAIIDADEFIRPLEEDRADVALSSYFDADPNVSAVAINWACYGSSNHLHHNEGLVLERFTMRSEQAFAVNRLVKSVIRLDRYHSPFSNPHVFRMTVGRYIDTGGSNAEWDPQRGDGVSTRCIWDKIRIDHFLVKSLDEFESIKRQRGRADVLPGHPLFIRDTRFFYTHNRNDVYDPMPKNLVDETKNEIQKIESRLKAIDEQRTNLVSTAYPSVNGNNPS